MTISASTARDKTIQDYYARVAPEVQFAPETWDATIAALFRGEHEYGSVRLPIPDR